MASQCVGQQWCVWDTITHFKTSSKLASYLKNKMIVFIFSNERPCSSLGGENDKIKKYLGDCYKSFSFYLSQFNKIEHKVSQAKKEFFIWLTMLNSNWKWFFLFCHFKPNLAQKIIGWWGFRYNMFDPFPLQEMMIVNKNELLPSWKMRVIPVKIIWEGWNATDL